jgi:phosphomannomutase
MKITNLKDLKPKKLIVFDLDGTLAESKTSIDSEMIELVRQLLEKKKMAVIGGGKYEIFKWQFVSHLKFKKELLKNLNLFPTSGNSYYRYNSGWKKVYAHNLSAAEKKEIRSVFERIYKEIGYKAPKKVYGEVLEDRKSQLSWSPLGQDIVTVLGKRGLKMKEEWKRKNDPVRLRIAKLAAKYLPNLEVRVGGITTIDVTKKGIDKAYGVRQMEKYLKIKIKDMLYVGDAIYPGGNDYAAVKTGIDYIKIDTPEDTKKIIKYVIERA